MTRAREGHVMRDPTGVWRGQYMYTLSRGAGMDASARTSGGWAAGDPVSFDMSLRREVGLLLRGSVMDTGPGALPGECELVGWKLGSVVRFTKTYPPPPQTLVKGIATPLIEILRKALGDKACEGIVLAPNRVRYSGTLSADGSTI